jgi:hypothetical protein
VQVKAMEARKVKVRWLMAMGTALASVVTEAIKQGTEKASALARRRAQI